MEENMEMFEIEESVFDRIASLEVEINQMKRMIEENIRLIGEGDDIEGRNYLKQHLENEVHKKSEELTQLKSEIK